jgi:hypothetical protein
VEAFRRNMSMGELPQMVFLHGNVGIGTCLVGIGTCLEDRVKGFMGDTCDKCGKPLGPRKLLYPIGQKNYGSDAFIRGEWEIPRAAISQAYLMQIFGYSAPRTDVEAKSIMHGAWNTNQTHELAEIKLVDLKFSVQRPLAAGGTPPATALEDSVLLRSLTFAGCGGTSTSTSASFFIGVVSPGEGVCEAGIFVATKSFGAARSL